MRGALRLFAWAMLAVSAVIAVAGGAGWWLYQDLTAPGPLTQARTVVIPPRTGLGGIAALLAQHEVIRHALSFEIGATLSGNGSSLLAGEYEFPAGTSALAAAAILASGKTVEHRLTIPEGLTSAQIVALVRAAPALDGDTGKPPPEGALMPATYIYSYGNTRQALLGRMERAMARALQTAWAERRPDMPLADPRTDADPGLAGRAGGGARGRTGADRRRLRQPAAPRHAPAIGPDRDLCAERRRRQESSIAR